MIFSFGVVRQGLVVSFAMLMSIGILIAGYLLNFSSMTTFFTLYLMVIIILPPRRLISPLSIIHGYYFVWFILAPAFSELHAEDDFSSSLFYLAYGMIFLTYLTAVFGASSGQSEARRVSIKNHKFLNWSLNKNYHSINKLIFTLYLTSTVLILAIVVNSGGFAHWIAAPGDAFLNRQGSGVYVVLSHFSTFCLAALVGYVSYSSKSKVTLLIFIVWLIITSPVHGSKGLISLFLILSFTPWLRNIRFISLKGMFFSVALIFIFFFGLYLRNISWITPEEAIPYALNYFTTLRNLIILLEDFSPDFMRTFFLPFNKFLTPFGLNESIQYFDMNHLLTDKYFPTAWEIRATEQWPVEADLYLNFYFFFGLPLVFIYTFVIGRIYGSAQITNNLGSWIVSMLLIVSIVSHLRGSIINHLDFYLYPMFFLIYLMLRDKSFNS